MDKVFQIHLAGMVFTIEEKAYEKLKAYNESLRRHFAGNSEVVQDIEARMAELLQQRLGSNRTTLFTEDIHAVIETLGSINQMADADDTATPKETKAPLPPANKKLRRDPYDQSLGGVCSGLASFFDVDTVLIRVLFVLMLIAFGGGVLLYLVLWIAVPVAKGEEAVYMRMQRESKNKKLFRDNDSRVVGGVSSGLANYFGLDVVWIRVAFVIALAVFGTGFWLYVILWIIVPKAISASDKLLMKGKAVDIHSIQQQVMENQGGNKVNSIAEHGTHLIGIILKGIVKLIGSFAALILFIVVIAVSISMVAVFFNLGNTGPINDLINLSVEDKSLILAAKIGITLALLTPLVAVLMLIIKVLFNLSFANRAWFLSLLGLFLTGVGLLIYSGSSYANSIKESESKSQIYRLNKIDTLYLKGIEMPINEDASIEDMGELAFHDKGFVMNKTAILPEIDKIQIKTGRRDSIYLKVIKRAKGKNNEDAKTKIEMIEYAVEVKGNEITIPAYFAIGRDKIYSWQEVDIILVVPNGTIVNLDEAIKEYIDDSRMDEASGNFYKVSEGDLICTDCTYQSSDSGDYNESESIEK